MEMGVDLSPVLIYSVSEFN